MRIAISESKYLDSDYVIAFFSKKKEASFICEIKAIRVTFSKIKEQAAPRVI